MKLYDSVELAARNLRESVLRNGLTTTGIAVGVASLVAMLSLGVGLQQLAGRRLGRSGLFNTVVVFENRRTGRRQPVGIPSEAPINEELRQKIQKLPAVSEAYPEVRFSAELRYNGGSHIGTIAALPPSASQSDAFDSLQGKFFSSPDAHDAILQTDFAVGLATPPPPAGTPQSAAFGDDDSSLPPRTAAEKAARAKTAASLIGKDIVLRYAERQANPIPERSPRTPQQTPANAAAADALDQMNAADWGFSVVPRELTLHVVGITDEEPYGGMRSFAQGHVFIPMNLALSLKVMQTSDLRRATQTASASYQQLVGVVKSPTQVQSVADTIRGWGFGTFSLLDATRNLRRFFAILDMFLAIFGSLALAVASLGIINTLVMAILERRREIGIMKAIGASDGDVRSLFFAEAGAMGIFGGVGGVALGWLIGQAINFGTNIYLERQEFPPEKIWSVPLWLVGGAIAFSLLVSLAAGLYPAARAAKLNPVEALRYE